jgi:Holliday junction resolvase RusA-like endonuclease
MLDEDVFAEALSAYEDAVTNAAEARAERRFRAGDGRDAQYMARALSTAQAATAARELVVRLVTEGDGKQNPVTGGSSGDDRSIELEILAAPPVKQTPADAAERARQQRANEVIATAFGGKYPAWRMYQLPVALELSIEYDRHTSRSDSANIIGGIADQLERCNTYKNDRQLRRIHYVESPSPDGADRYRLRITPLAVT